jgi:hypothetical protein
MFMLVYVLASCMQMELDPLSRNLLAVPHSLVDVRGFLLKVGRRATHALI